MSSILDALRKLEEEKVEASQPIEAELSEAIAESDLVGPGPVRRRDGAHLPTGVVLAGGIALLLIIAIGVGTALLVTRQRFVPLEQAAQTNPSDTMAEPVTKVASVLPQQSIVVPAPKTAEVQPVEPTPVARPESSKPSVRTPAPAPLVPPKPSVAQPVIGAPQEMPQAQPLPAPKLAAATTPTEVVTEAPESPDAPVQETATPVVKEAPRVATPEPSRAPAATPAPEETDTAEPEPLPQTFPALTTEPSNTEASPAPPAPILAKADVEAAGPAKSEIVPEAPVRKPPVSRVAKRVDKPTTPAWAEDEVPSRSLSGTAKTAANTANEEVNLDTLPVLTDSDRERLDLPEIKINLISVPNKSRARTSVLINYSKVYIGKKIPGTDATLIGAELDGVGIEIDGLRYFVAK